ncbi:Ferredoxin--nitrite reductase, chloroplastic [Porphyridium purpureum]|uniref:Ferredoxin--nitrite reductase, chloroplastic n=1 Tax=Porphyridium purpureum TaxID=35688 RepID=A0A5J4YSY7_PORPP|nr:Ferredoxin--nitrite reductase, chloroplastic [Porphyridium purpureum]|eukprot:POR2445..scf236_6
MAAFVSSVTSWTGATHRRAARGTCGQLRMTLAEPEVEVSAGSGLAYLSPAARERATAKNANPVEKLKNAKCGSNIWTEVFEMSRLIREGKTSWEDLNLDDREKRLKWVGLFHREKATPGRFMMRLRVPNGELTAEQLDFFADVVEKYGEIGVIDITTRQNIQLRGIDMGDVEDILNGLKKLGLTSVQSGMDNLRNMVGNPLAGIDPLELVDTRPYMRDIQDMVTRDGLGNPELCNLPRKFNISMNSTGDNFAHTHINDLGLDAIVHPELGLGFNVIVGGMFSGQRVAMSVPMDTFVPADKVVALCKAVLEVFRDFGPRATRTKCRFMYLVDELGVEKIRELVAQYMDYDGELPRAVPKTESGQHRHILGVHPQKQEGLSWVGISVPVGRMLPADSRALADVARKYGDGTIRITVDQNVIIPNVPTDKVSEMIAEPIFSSFKVTPGKLMGSLVSCTGAQFCPFGLVETKNRAKHVAEILESRLDMPKSVRIHWTGCPNSCGQAQVGDIGLMGSPARLDGKAVEGVRILLGGEIGSAPELATDFEKSVPAADEHLIPKLEAILIEKFGASLLPGALVMLGSPRIICEDVNGVFAFLTLLSVLVDSIPRAFVSL